MPGVTKEQIEAAKQISAIQFLRRYRPGQLEKDAARGELHLKDHDSFKICEATSLWHWKSRDVGGRSALDYLIKVEGLGFVEAVRQLCDELPVCLPPPQPVERKPFALPEPAPNNRRVFAYLLKRGIDRKVIEACVRAGLLYESAGYHNAVFVGKDEKNVPRYAFLRGTYTQGKPFKAEVSGSDKRYSFCLPPRGEASRVAVYEAAIETLAHLTLEKTTDKYRCPWEESMRQWMERKLEHLSLPQLWRAFWPVTRKSQKSRSAPTTMLLAAGPESASPSTTKASTRSR